MKTFRKADKVSKRDQSLTKVNEHETRRKLRKRQVKKIILE